jgi:hypothetical protein
MESLHLSRHAPTCGSMLSDNDKEEAWTLLLEWLEHHDIVELLDALSDTDWCRGTGSMSRSRHQTITARMGEIQWSAVKFVQRRLLDAHSIGTSNQPVAPHRSAHIRNLTLRLAIALMEACYLCCELTKHQVSDLIKLFVLSCSPVAREHPRRRFMRLTIDCSPLRWCLVVSCPEMPEG